MGFADGSPVGRGVIVGITVGKGVGRGDSVGEKEGCGDTVGLKVGETIPVGGSVTATGRGEGIGESVPGPAVVDPIDGAAVGGCAKARGSNDTATSHSSS